MIKTERLAHIDAIRAIAALLVVVMHCSEVARTISPTNEAIGDWLFQLAYSVDFGRIGVVLFFAISGFVIPSSLRKTQHFLTFWVRRFFRLYPVFWLSIPLGLISQWWIWGRFPSVSMILANITMIPEAFGQTFIQGLYWTLAVEMLFYVLCYLLFLIGLLRSPVVLALISSLFAAAFYGYINWAMGPFLEIARTYFPTIESIAWGFNLGHLSIMFMGAAFRLAYDNQSSSWGRYALVAVLIFWLIVYPATGWSVYNAHEDKVLVVRIYASYTIAILSFLILTTTLKLGSPMLAWLGRISYSVYLFHPVVIWGGTKLSQLYFPNLPIGVVGYTVIWTGISILISGVAFKCIEKPFNRIGARISDWLNRKRETASQTGVEWPLGDPEITPKRRARQS